MAQSRGRSLNLLGVQPWLRLSSTPETLKELVCDGPAAAMFHRRHGAGAAYRISASLDPADRFAWLGKTEAEAIQFLRHGIGSG